MAARTWRQKLQPASFRNVPFLVRAVEGTHGRRLASHEYPLRDDPWHEDLGRLAKSFSFEAYVIEPDHIPAALALIAACEKDGPGKLIHPWIGEVDVVLTECKVRFSHEEGGWATFALSFAEAGKPVYPIAEKNAEAAVDKVAAEAKDKASTRFLKGFSVDKVAGWVSDHISETLKDGIGAIEKALGTTGGIANISAWAHDLAGVAQTAATIIRNPAGLASRILGLIDLGNVTGVKDLVQFPLSVANLFQAAAHGTYAATWQSYLPLSQYGLAYGFFSPTTSSRSKDNNNVAELNTLIRRTAIAEMSRAAVREDHATQQEATAVLTAIQEAVDRELYVIDRQRAFTSPQPALTNTQRVLDNQARAAEEADLASAIDAAGEALQDVARTTTLVLSRKIATLPRTYTVVPASSSVSPLPAVSGAIAPRLFGLVPEQTIAAIVIAYNVYGDNIRDVESRADQIIVRNHVPHAGFVPGGEPLELISV